MAPGNELSSAVLLSNPRPGYKESDGRLPILITLIIPRINFFVVVMIDIVIAMERLSFAARGNPHSRAGVDIWLGDRLFLLIAPPEPAARGKEVVAHLLEDRIHHLRLRVCRAERKQPRRTLSLLWYLC